MLRPALEHTARPTPPAAARPPGRARPPRPGAARPARPPAPGRDGSRPGEYSGERPFYSLPRPAGGLVAAMKVSVPKESAAGERRVALVPEVVQRLAKQGGHDVVVESGAGEPTFPDAALHRGGRDHRRRLLGRGGGQGGAAERRGDRPASARPGADRAPPAADERRRRPRAGRRRRHELRDGGDPAHHARAVDGRAVLPGHRRGLPRRADRRPGAAQVLPDAHHRRRHGPAREGARARRRRRRACRRSPPPAASARWSRRSTCAAR